MKPIFYNNKSFVITHEITPTTTVLHVANNHGIASLAPGEEYIVGTIVPRSGEGNLEIIHIIGVDDTTFIIERGKEGTAPQSYLLGAVLEFRLTAESITRMGAQALREELADSGGAGMVRNGGKTVGEIIDHAQIVVKSISELRGFTPEILTNQNPVCTVLCHTVDGDGGGGTFVWDPSSASQDDNGTIIGESALGRWIRVIDGPVYAEWFGARAFRPVFDNAELYDSTRAFQAASDYVGVGGSWLWRGVHRITSTVFIPRRQSFGSLGTSRSWNPGGLTNWQGPNKPGAQHLDNGVFFDPPSKTGYLFQCEEDARPHDFLAYSLGFNEFGIDVTHSQPASKHYSVACFRYNKYLTLKDVSVWLFKTAFLSEGFDGNQGSFYGTFYNPEVGRCYEMFSFNTEQPYNQRVFNPKMTATSRFLNCSTGISNFTIHGGSIEGWRETSPIRGSGSMAIFGTYFETFNTEANGSIFYLNADGNYFNLTYQGGMCYLNNTSGFMFSEKANTKISSSGNTFIWGGQGISPTRYIYRYNATAQATSSGFGVGDSYIGARNSWAYVNANLDVRADPPGASVLDDFLDIGRTALRFHALGSEPANRVSGAIYLANGGTWNPLSRQGGYPYFVCYRNGWEAL